MEESQNAQIHNKKEEKLLFDTSSVVTNAISSHGYAFLKKLAGANPHVVSKVNLKDVDYKVYQARLPEISKQGEFIKGLQELIIQKTDKILFCEHWKLKCQVPSDFLIKDKYENLLPLEHLMEVNPVLRRDIFLKNVREGDVLIVMAMGTVDKNLQAVKLISTDGGHHRSVTGMLLNNFKILLKKQCTKVPFVDADPSSGMWLPGTRLRVEVLYVSQNNVYVGTLGMTMPEEKQGKFPLGKVNSSAVPSVFSADGDSHKEKYVIDCLQKMKSFHNPRAIKCLADKFGIDLFSHGTLMGTFRESVPENESFYALRNAQASQWAYKSVAEGVACYKKGKHEEAFQCLSKALQIDPENAEAYVAKGALLGNLGKYDKAIEAFEQALKFNPKHTNAKKYMCETMVERGKQFEEEKKFQKAKEEFQKVLSINPEHTGANEALLSLLANKQTSPCQLNPREEGSSHILQEAAEVKMDNEAAAPSIPEKVTSETTSDVSEVDNEARATPSSPPMARGEVKAKPSPPPMARGEVKAKPSPPLTARAEVKAKPSSPLMARGEVKAKPSSPLMARGEVKAKPSSPLMARGEVKAKPSSPLIARGEVKAKPSSPSTVTSGAISSSSVKVADEKGRQHSPSYNSLSEFCLGSLKSRVPFTSIPPPPLVSLAAVDKSATTSCQGHEENLSPKEVPLEKSCISHNPGQVFYNTLPHAYSHHSSQIYRTLDSVVPVREYEEYIKEVPPAMGIPGYANLPMSYAAYLDSSTRCYASQGSKHGPLLMSASEEAPIIQPDTSVKTEEDDRYKAEVEMFLRKIQAREPMKRSSSCSQSPDSRKRSTDRSESSGKESRRSRSPSSSSCSSCSSRYRRSRKRKRLNKSTWSKSKVKHAAREATQPELEGSSRSRSSSVCSDMDTKQQRNSSGSPSHSSKNKRRNRNVSVSSSPTRKKSKKGKKKKKKAKNKHKTKKHKLSKKKLSLLHTKSSSKKSNIHSTSPDRKRKRKRSRSASSTDESRTRSVSSSSTSSSHHREKMNREHKTKKARSVQKAKAKEKITCSEKDASPSYTSPRPSDKLESLQRRIEILYTKYNKTLAKAQEMAVRGEIAIASTEIEADHSKGGLYTCYNKESQVAAKQKHSKSKRKRSSSISSEASLLYVSSKVKVKKRKSHKVVQKEEGRVSAGLKRERSTPSSDSSVCCSLSERTSSKYEKVALQKMDGCAHVKDKTEELVSTAAHDSLLSTVYMPKKVPDSPSQTAQLSSVIVVPDRFEAATSSKEKCMDDAYSGSSGYKQSSLSPSGCSKSRHIDADLAVAHSTGRKSTQDEGMDTSTKATLEVYETFLARAKEKKREEMLKRNKEFLKPRVD